ncbi:uncharacterized protein LOC108465629 [Gossypium arboreum]|uniref:uncharacterized protein LOC108465629 n=1 Tax=Gossypium arboreum TaxID=29729 RepID=UPI0008197739|nr:uncharacterized protein LOC108465629 [Gossypium arboreum]
MASSGFSPAAPPIFNGEGYHIWVVKMKTYLQALDLWEVVNLDVELVPLRVNPTVAQIRQHADERTKRHKAMSCIQNCVLDVIFTRIMACETPKQAWNKLKEEFQGIERTRQQQLLNLRRDFENLKMEEETVKQYSDRIMVVVNSIRLLGEQFSEVRIVEKMISTLPERYEAKISSLKDSKDLTSISLTELINALYAQEQRRASRLEEHQKGIAKDMVIQKQIVGLDQMCSANMGHVEKVCKNKGKPRQGQPQQPKAEARVAEEGSDHEEQVFAVSCSAAKEKTTKGWFIDSGCTNQMTPDAKEKATKGWLIDNGCTNHMTPDISIFKTIDRSFKTKVKVGNGHFIKAEGKGDVLISTPTGNKLVSNVLLVPEIDRSLLSIAQLLEKGYTVVFKGNECQINDPTGFKLMSVAMTDKSFVMDWNKGLHTAYTASLDESKLWHQRLDHANYRSMDQLTKEDPVENFINSDEKEEVCEVCQPGKQGRLPFPSNKAWRASERL